jgi:hypothetical protein
MLLFDKYRGRKRNAGGEVLAGLGRRIFGFFVRDRETSAVFAFFWSVGGPVRFGGWGSL